MNVARSLRRYGCNLRGKFLDEGNGEGAAAAFTRQRDGIETCTLADPRDDSRLRGRHEALAGGCPCKRALEARHGREQILIGQERGARLVREQKLEAQGGLSSGSVIEEHGF